MGLVQRNPCREIKRNKEVTRDRYVTDEELEASKEICPEWLKLYLPIKSLTGLRQQDMLVLKKEDVREEGTLLFVRPQKTQTTTKKQFLIALSPELSSLMKSLPQHGPYFFQTRTGNPYSGSGFRSIWTRLMSKFVSAGHERFREHDIRGKVATDMVDPVAAQLLLGHASIVMTEAYIRQRRTEVVQPLKREQK